MEAKQEIATAEGGPSSDPAESHADVLIADTADLERFAS